ncbi:MAG: hypothetical protein H0V82_11380 [Candidatus Protochlamydia sp.]|nr:hypothetical protein [Candidatus Protochlamydia sp.]
MNIYNYNVKSYSEPKYSDRFIVNRNETLFRYNALIHQKPETAYESELFKTLFNDLNPKSRVLFKNNDVFPEEKKFKKIAPDFIKDYYQLHAQYDIQDKNSLSFGKNNKLAVASMNGCYLVDMNALCDNQLSSLKTEGNKAIYWDTSQDQIICYNGFGSFIEFVKNKNNVNIADVQADKILNGFNFNFDEVITQVKLKNKILSCIAGKVYFTFDTRTKNSYENLIHVSKFAQSLTCFKDSPDNTKLAFGNDLGELKIFDKRKLGKIWDMESVQSKINDIAWHPANSDQAAVAHTGNSIGIYNAEGSGKIKNIESPFSALSLIWSTPHTLISSHYNKNSKKEVDSQPIKIWDLKTSRVAEKVTSGDWYAQTRLQESDDKSMVAFFSENLRFLKVNANESTIKKEKRKDTLKPESFFYHEIR